MCERNLLEAGLGAQRGTNSLLKPVPKLPTQIRETLTMKGQWHRLTRAEASEGGLETIRSVSCIYVSPCLCRKDRATKTSRYPKNSSRESSVTILVCVKELELPNFVEDNIPGTAQVVCIAEDLELPNFFSDH